MKSIIFCLVTLFSINAFSGTIENSKTKETVSFSLNELDSTITITSRAAGIESKVIALNRISASDDYDTELFILTKWSFDWAYGSQYIPPFTPFALALNVLDLLYVPLAKTTDLAYNSQERKVFKKIMIAIVSDETVVVRNNLFDRVINNLNKYPAIK